MTGSPMVATRRRSVPGARDSDSPPASDGRRPRRASDRRRRRRRPTRADRGRSRSFARRRETAIDQRQHVVDGVAVEPGHEIDVGGETREAAWPRSAASDQESTDSAPGRSRPDPARAAFDRAPSAPNRRWPSSPMRPSVPAMRSGTPLVRTMYRTRSWRACRDSQVDDWRLDLRLVVGAGDNFGHCRS